MLCPKCENNGIHVVFEDVISCKCGSDISINYYVCDECGFIWRMQDGKFLDGGFFIKDLMEIVVSGLYVGMFKENADSSNNDLLTSLLHTCIRCGAIATETDKNSFVCTSCGFMWEVDDNVN